MQSWTCSWEVIISLCTDNTCRLNNVPFLTPETKQVHPAGGKKQHWRWTEPTLDFYLQTFIVVFSLGCKAFEMAQQLGRLPNPLTVTHTPIWEGSETIGSISKGKGKIRKAYHELSPVYVQSGLLPSPLLVHGETLCDAAFSATFAKTLPQQSKDHLQW